VEITLGGKNALVTGTSSGIGQGIAVALAAAGPNVGINYRSNPDGAQETSPRAGTPQDIAAMVVFLCSDHASFSTGGTYLVGGGWMLT
jgi:glucose 1-dehydrogenase